jgi:GT2 family glycosyltransferase
MAGVTVVAATREAESNFVANTALGKTLAAYAHFGIGTRLFYSNTHGLPECYNRAIEETADEDEILIFLHDDVFLPDFFWIRRVTAALKMFSLVGVAGNKRRVPKQPAWAFTRIHPTEHTLEWDEQRFLSGIVGHGAGFPCNVTMYGPDEQACLLLDGVLLGARKSTFTRHGIRFDEQFKFHFYDMDICRQFERAGLTMGTSSVSIIHDSGGNFGTPEWAAGYKDYLQKWDQ